MSKYDAERQSLGISSSGASTATISKYDAERGTSSAPVSASKSKYADERLQLNNPSQAPSIDSIHADQHQTEQTVGFKPQPFSNEPVQPTQPSAWKGILDNPIVHGITKGAETALSVVQKPFEAVSTGAADLYGFLNNHHLISSDVGAHKQQNLDGTTTTNYPSQPRNFLQDVVNILSNTNEHVSSDAWHGALPNLNKMQGTNADWQDVIDFGAQSLPLGEIAAPLKFATKGMKGLAEAKLATGSEKVLSKEPLLPSYNGVGLNSNVGGKPSLVNPDYIGNFNKNKPIPLASTLDGKPNMLVNKPSITKEEFKNMTDSGDYFIRTVRTPQKDMAGRTSTPAGKIGIDLGLSSDTHKGLSGFNLKDQARMLEWMGKEGWAHENVAVYKGKPTKDQVTLDPGEVEFNPSQLVGYVPTNVFKEHGGDFHKALTSIDSNHNINEITPNNPIQSAEAMKQGWFSNLFGDQGVGISAFNDTKRISKDPLTTEGAIVSSGIKNDAQGIKDSIAAKAREVYQNHVDQLSPLKTISKETYNTAMDTARSNNIANNIIHDKFVTPEGNVVGPGLSDIFNKVARGQDKQFVDYLTLRHAVTRMDRGEQVYADSLNMTAAKAQERLSVLEQRHPGFSDIAKEWDGFNANVLQHYGVNEGLISPEAFKALQEKNPNYSPMNRQFSRSEKPGRSFLAKSTSSSFSGQKAPIKEVSPTGSARNIVDPRKSTIENVGAWVNASMRNRTMQSMVDAIKTNPESFNGVAEIVQKPIGGADLNKVLMDGGTDDFVESLNTDYKNLFKKTNVDGENIVRAMVNGQPVYLKVHDPEIVKTLIGMGPQASNVLIDTMRAFSNATKRGATGLLSPVFAVKGATMDLVQSAIQAKNPVKQAAYTVYAIFSGIGDRLNIPGLKNMAEEFRRSGGEYSAALKGDRKLNTSVSQLRRDPILSPQNVARGLAGAVKAPFKALESIGNIAENAPRIAASKLEMNRLGGARTPENVRQAMNAGREATVNFSRKGALSHDIEGFIPYNNASIQGTYRVLKSFKDNPVRTAGAVATLGVLPKLYEYAQFHNDPDYQNLPARERMRFLFVNKNADGTFTKIPMDPAYNSIGEMTIEALRHFKDQDPTAFKGTADALANAWLPPAVTGAAQGITQGGGLDKSIAGALNATVAAPFVATTANQSFTGAPIVSKAVADRSPQYQYDERTSAIAKKLTDFTGMAPMKIDYLLRAYGGDPARLLLPLTSDVGAGNVRNTVLKNFIVDPAVTTNLTNDFYNGKDKLTRAYRDFQEVKAPLPTWFTPELHTMVTSTVKDSLTKTLSGLAAEKKTISSDSSLSASQKTQKLRDVQQKINKIYIDVNSRMEKQKVPLN